jgi:beta-lactamase class A
MTSSRGCRALLGAAALATTAVTGFAHRATVAAAGQQAATSVEAAAAGRVALRERFAATLREIAAGVDGVVGYVVVDLASGDRFAAHEGVPFPTASTIKIAILYELYRQADEGRLDLDEVRPLPAGARAAGSGVLGELRAPALTLRDYATLMILVSDNSATNLLIDTVGMDRVNARMRALGVEGLALRRRMMDVDAARRGDENVATPAALARLLDVVRTGEGLGAASRAAYAYFTRLAAGGDYGRLIPR